MRRFLIDANLPRRLSVWNSDRFEFVHDLGAGWSDTQVWDHAMERSLTIVSKDADFRMRRLSAGRGPRLIHVRLGNLRIAELRSFLIEHWPEIAQMSAENDLVSVYADRIEAVGSPLK